MPGNAVSTTDSNFSSEVKRANNSFASICETLTGLCRLEEIKPENEDEIEVFDVDDSSAETDSLAETDSSAKMIRYGDKMLSMGEGTDFFLHFFDDNLDFIADEPDAQRASEGRRTRNTEREARRVPEGRRTRYTGGDARSAMAQRNDDKSYQQEISFLVVATASLDAKIFLDKKNSLCMGVTYNNGNFAPCFRDYLRRLSEKHKDNPQMITIAHALQILWTRLKVDDQQNLNLKQLQAILEKVVKDVQTGKLLDKNVSDIFTERSRFTKKIDKIINATKRTVE